MSSVMYNVLKIWHLTLYVLNFVNISVICIIIMYQLMGIFASNEIR